MLHVKCVQQGRKQHHFKKAVIAIVVLLTGSIPRQKKIANDFTIRTLFNLMVFVTFSFPYYFFSLHCLISLEMFFFTFLRLEKGKIAKPTEKMGLVRW